MELGFLKSSKPMQIAWKYNGDKEIELHWHGYSSTIQGTNNDFSLVKIQTKISKIF